MTDKTDREIMQKALDAMLNFPNDISDEMFESIRSLKPALAEPEQKPVAWVYSEGLAALKAGKCWTAYGTKQDKDNSIPLYTAPQQREWQGLTDEEVGALTVFDGLHHVEIPILANFVWAVEAKLKEKNT